MLLSVFLAAAAPAAADTRRVADPRDRNLLVDPIAATHGHHPKRPGLLVHTVQMAERWDAGELLGGQIDIQLPDRDRAPDRRVYFALGERRLSVLVHRLRPR